MAINPTSPRPSASLGQPAAASAPATSGSTPSAPAQPAAAAPAAASTGAAPALAAPASAVTAPAPTAGVPMMNAVPVPMGPGYSQLPLQQGVQWVPVLRTVQPPAPAQPAAAATPAADASVAGSTPAAAGETAAATPADETAAAAEAKPVTPPTYAEEMGEKAKAFVIKTLEDNPEWQDKLQDLNLDSLMDDPDSFLNDILRQLNRSRLFKMAKPFVKRGGHILVRLFPDNVQPMAKNVIDWLTGPAPSKDAPAKKDAPAALDDLGGGGGNPFDNLDAGEPDAGAQPDLAKILGRSTGASEDAGLEDVPSSDAAPPDLGGLEDLLGGGKKLAGDPLDESAA